MAEFRFDIDVTITDPRKAARNAAAPSLLALRAIVVEAPNEDEARIRADLILAAIKAGK